MEDNVTIDIEDIASELLILNKHTIDRLFALDDCVNCIALYMFYYKTAKWQKTDKIKATDEYVMKCLKWGKNKLTDTKSALKGCGLIDTVILRENGRIKDWLVKVHYIVPKEQADKAKIVVNDQRYCKQEVVETRTCSQETNALRDNPKCLKITEEMLKDKNKETKKESLQQAKDIIAFFNEHRGNMPLVLKETPQRISMVTARIKEYSFDDVKNAILLAEQSAFLQGKTNKNWMANFDWIIKPNNFPKVLEGNYNNENEKPVEKDPNEAWWDETWEKMTKV